MIKMVMFHTHILLGITVFLVANNFFTGGNEIIFFLLVLLGSILPDIDARRSKINQWTGIIGIFIAFFAKHRGLFHSLILHASLMFVITIYWSNYYAWALFLGYIAHIIGDSITKMGVQIFYPFSNFKVRGPLRSGGFTEGIILVCLAFFIIKKILFS